MLTINPLTEQSLTSAGQVDNAYTVSERLVIRAERGVLHTTVEAVSQPFVKRYTDEAPDYAAILADPAQQVYLAWLDGALAGEAFLKPWWNGYTCLEYIAVNPDCRRNGVGRALIEACQAWTRAQHSPGIYLETQDINVAGCRLYAACGFTLGGFDRFVYRALPNPLDETALYWYWLAVDQSE